MQLLLMPLGPGGGDIVTPAPTPVSIDVIVQARLSGSYEAMVIADQAPVVYYPLNGTNLDTSGNGHNTTTAGSPATTFTLLDPGNGDDQLATSFDGVDDVVISTDICDFSGTASFTASFWIQVSAIHASSFMRLVSKENVDGGGTQGWNVTLVPQSDVAHAGCIQFERVLNGNAVTAYSPIAVSLNTPHHVLVEYTSDQFVRVWLDGVMGTAVASAASILNHSQPLKIGGHSLLGAGYFFAGILDELSIASGTPMNLVNIAEHAAQGWTPIEDALSADGIRIRYGIDGVTPIDCVAGPGECSFALRNDGGNSGSTQGWYSPSHASVRDGWTTDIQFRVKITHLGITYTKFRGRVGALTPAPWIYGERRVHVVAYDLMHRLMMAGLRAIPMQVNQSDIALMTAVINASLDQFSTGTDEAIALSFDEGFLTVGAFETYPYAFDDIARGTSALAAIHDVAISGLAFCYANAHGALMWQNRLARANRQVAATFLDSMHGLTVTHSVEKAFNHTVVAIHQRSVGSGNVVLWAWEGDPLVVYPGETKEIWAEFRDPDDVRDLIGATSVVTPVASTDYAGDALPDGSGSDLTGDLDVSIEAFASSAKITIENTGSQDVYLVNNAGENLLQLRGIPIFRDGDQTYEQTVGTGNRLLTLDLPYQVSADVAQAFANYLVAAYSAPLPLEAIELVGNRSDEFMYDILARDVGDRIRVTETMTGMTLVDAIIHNVEFSIEQGASPVVRCRWGLGPYLGGAVAGGGGATIPAPPPPAQDPDDVDELVVNYSGAASGTHNLTTDGALALSTPGAYTFAFSRSGLDVRVAGVAAGGRGGDGITGGAGAGGGGGGASHTTGIVVPITSLNYSGLVGSPLGTSGGATDSNTSFVRTTPTALTHLLLSGGGVGTGGSGPGGTGGTVVVGGGGTAGSNGGSGGGTEEDGDPGTAGTTGGGGGGGGSAPGATTYDGGVGGDGEDQVVTTFDPVPSSSTDAVAGSSGVFGSGNSGGGGGGPGGGVLLGGVYAGGGGGGGGGGAPSGSLGGDGGLGGQGVLTLTLEP